MSRLLACAIVSGLAWLAPQSVCAEPPPPDAAVAGPIGGHGAPADRTGADLFCRTWQSAAFAAAEGLLTDSPFDDDGDQYASLDALVVAGPGREQTLVERPGAVDGTGEAFRSAAGPRAPPSFHR
jgi:hypothetical protein